MVMSADKLGMEISEPERVLEEFRQKLIYSLQKEKDKLREMVNKDAKIILTKAYQESSALTAKAQEEAKDIIIQAKEQADREVENILSQARQKAEDLINESEETIRRDSKEKTRKEVEAIIRTAKEDAAKQNTRILQAARDETNKMLAAARKEAETITLSATELKQKAATELASAQKKTADAVEEALNASRKTAAEKAEKEAAEIIAQAKLRAQKEREFVLANALKDAKQQAEAESAQIIQKAQEEAEGIVIAAKEKVRIQIEESTRLMLDIQQRMHNVMGVGLDIKPKETRAPENNRPVNPPTPAREEKAAPVEVKPPVVNETQNKGNPLNFDEENQTYEGRLKIDIAPPTDNEQITALEKQLLKTPSLRITARGGAEDGSAWIELDITKPTVLLDILKKIPSVKDVVGAKSYVIVAMKSKQLV